MKFFICVSRSFAVAILIVGAHCVALGGERTVEFNRDVRPILSDACYHCHGPDKGKRKAGLRLDTEDGAFADLGGHKAIVSGNPNRSELFRRLTAEEAGERMPPVSSGRMVSKEQVEMVRRWIIQGAKWQKHWSLIPPSRPAVPEVKRGDWPRNPIDLFILVRLEKEGLAPAPEADRATLIRRVSLDLTGLPPTLAEVDAFVADPSPNAYEKVVDRLLRSSRYGERMAVRWLDAARYADTSGYQTDGERFMWRWRDWVIDAFNRNLPFDQFTIEQLAGDLLPQPSLDQRIATGFNRNHRGNSEGGIVPEEFAVEYVVDRVETTSTVWLGMTIGCARCHDHKYDPISQNEFYGLYAYFNNVPEQGRASKLGNSPPYIPSPTLPMQRQLADVEARLAAAESAYRDMQPKLDRAQQEWERNVLPTDLETWSPTQYLTAHFPLEGEHNPKLKIEDGNPSFGAGRLGKGADLDGKTFLEAPSDGDYGYLDRFSMGAWIYPRKLDGAIISRMAEEPQTLGYNLILDKGKIHVHMTSRWLDDAMRVETERTLRSGQWHHVFVTYDGSRAAKGIAVFVDGKPEKTRILLDELNQTFKNKEPLRIGSGGGPASRFLGLIDDVRFYGECLGGEEVASLSVPEPIGVLCALPPDRRTAEQSIKLRACFLDKHAPEAMRQASKKVQSLQRERARLVESFPTTMVMAEMDPPRATRVLLRGAYDKPGPEVQRGVPASLPTLPPGDKNNRLRLARWLMDPGNPLTARVAVNRFWQMYFGVGLVKTVDDFGAQGDLPSHPELLDWLATEFIRAKWDVKALQKLIVMSSAYRQSSKVTRALAQRDPENRLVGRGPRFRLPAEMIRDQALAASGLLVDRVGGPSVKPYQPAGLWGELTGGEEYKQDNGDKLYRRSLYTFWKRTVAPPAMVNFDASGREFCVVRESRTNTPLQALNLMNDVTFVEAARVLAQRVMLEATNPEDRISRAFRHVLARKPTSVESGILLNAFRGHADEYQKSPKDAAKLVSVGEFPRDGKINVGELAAYTAVAGMILNLDEAVTKE